MATHNDLGKKGEQLAVDYLLKNNYTILKRNYRYLKAEIDIIAKKDETIVSVEVKTRTTTYFGNPQDFISPKKIALLTTAMDDYMIKNHLDEEVRFDIIAIIYSQKSVKLQHIKDAFLHF